ncbi:MAG: PQQ-dependent sugar dehydrogenase, partial [Pseudomonadota bacterium]
MRLLVSFALAVWPAAVLALDTERGAVTVSPVVTGLDAPWGVAQMPDGGLLVTERDGNLIHVASGSAQSVRGVPRVAAQGQGGLLDITLARDFATSRTLWLTYSKPQGRGSGTALAAAELSADGRRLENVRDLFESAPGGSTGRHFGSRVVEARDGTLYVTIGDRGDRPSAQDRANHN